MATSAAPIAKTGKYGDLRRRLVFLLLALVVYRVGAHIPVPGIDPAQLQQLFSGQQGILNLFNMFSGGALSRFTVFALGIMPYISASIIMQLMTYAVPTFEQLKKEGEAGRRKITQYTRYGTLGLAIFQSLGIAMALEGQAGLVIDPGLAFRFTAVVSLVAGTMFLMWLGEQITSRGIGNGISLIIMAGIVAQLPSALGLKYSLTPPNPDTHEMRSVLKTFSTIPIPPEPITSVTSNGPIFPTALGSSLGPKSRSSEKDKPPWAAPASGLAGCSFSTRRTRTQSISGAAAASSRARS